MAAGVARALLIGGVSVPALDLSSLSQIPSSMKPAPNASGHDEIHDSAMLSSTISSIDTPNATPLRSINIHSSVTSSLASTPRPDRERSRDASDEGRSGGRSIFHSASVVRAPVTTRSGPSATTTRNTAGPFSAINAGAPSGTTSRFSVFRQTQGPGPQVRVQRKRESLERLYEMVQLPPSLTLCNVMLRCNAVMQCYRLLSYITLRAPSRSRGGETPLSHLRQHSKLLFQVDFEDKHYPAAWI
jgi:hypothetical protein